MTQLQTGSRDLGQEANDPVNEQKAIMTQLDRKWDAGQEAS